MILQNFDNKSTLSKTSRSITRRSKRKCGLYVEESLYKDAERRRAKRELE